MDLEEFLTAAADPKIIEQSEMQQMYGFTGTSKGYVQILSGQSAGKVLFDVVFHCVRQQAEHHLRLKGPEVLEVAEPHEHQGCSQVVAGRFGPLGDKFMVAAVEVSTGEEVWRRNCFCLRQALLKI